MSTTVPGPSGRPVNATTPEIINKIHHIVMVDGRLKHVRQLVLCTSRVNGYIIFGTKI